MAATLYNGLDTAPGMLADAVNTQLNASFVAGTNLANHLVAHARGVVPAGLPNAIHVPYRFILLILGAVARVDGSAILAAVNPFRGTWLDAWVEAAVQKLDTLGAFANPYSSLEAMIEGCIHYALAQAVYPAEFIFTAADYPINLNWVPGHFGALANQIWTCGLRFDLFAADASSSLRELFTFAYEAAPFYVRSQVIAPGGSFVRMSKAYLGQMEKHAGLPPGDMDSALALETIADFSVSVALPKELWVVPHGLSQSLRLFNQRCALADAGTSAGSSAAAEEAILRQNSLQLMWRLDKAVILLGGVGSSAEAFAYLERIYHALPSDRRPSGAKPLFRITTANAALNADKVAAEVARTANVESRVKAIEDFTREVHAGIDAARRSLGSSSGDGAASTPLDASIVHAGGLPPAPSTEAALGKFAPLRVKIEAALIKGDYSLAWACVAMGLQLAPLQILFNVSKIHASDPTFKALQNQRGELPEYLGAELIASFRKENPRMITPDNSMLLDGFQLNGPAFKLLIQLKLGELNIYDTVVQEIHDLLGSYSHVPRTNWHLTIVDSDKMRQMGKGGHRLLRAVGFLDEPTQTADQLTYEGFVNELIVALSQGGMIQEEGERLAHYEQIIACYLEVLTHCGQRAASLLRANPDGEPLGYFIPSIALCGPLNKMRGLHSAAATFRNRNNARKPGGSEPLAPTEQPVSLVGRLSKEYGNSNYPSLTGKQPYSGDDDYSWGKWPKTTADPSTVGSKPQLTWDSADGKIIYAGYTGKHAYYRDILTQWLGAKCLPSMVCVHGAIACRTPQECGKSHVNAAHAQPTKRLENALQAAKAPPYSEGDGAAGGSGDGTLVLADGDGSAAADGGAPVASTEAGAGRGQGKGGKGGGKGKGKGGKGKGKGKGGRGQGKGKGGRSAFW